MEIEEWRDIPEYENRYQASSLGRVKSLSRKINTWNGYKTIPETILKLRLRNGYYAWKNKSVHRLVAITFIPIVEGKNFVNHINGNKLDNKITNLEWCTAKENIAHAWTTGLSNNSTRLKMSEKAKLRTGSKNSCWRAKVVILSLDEEQVFIAESLVDAALWVASNSRFIKASKSNISRVCNGKLDNCYGFKYKYEE